MGFPSGSDGKESAWNAENPGLILSWEDPLEKGMATHSSILAWKIPWTEEPGGLQSMGLQRVGHNWATDTFTFNSQHSEYAMLLPFWAQGMFVTELIMLSDFQSIFMGFLLCGAVTASGDLGHGFPLGLFLLKAEWSGWKGTRDLPGLWVSEHHPALPCHRLGVAALSPLQMSIVFPLFSFILKNNLSVLRK